jgi:hypothetical protein
MPSPFAIRIAFEIFSLGVGLFTAMILLNPPRSEKHGALPMPLDPLSQFTIVALCVMAPWFAFLLLVASYLAQLSSRR